MLKVWAVKSAIVSSILVTYLVSRSDEVSANVVNKDEKKIPLVINTWAFTNATKKAWDILVSRGSALDALTLGCTVCEDEQCDGTVGYGGSPDENGETTLDAMIFDGDSMDMGAVAGLRRIKQGIATARHVLQNTEHSILAGNLATDFAKAVGFEEQSLSTNFSVNMWKTWKINKCQPNFWHSVQPDPKNNCGPYQPLQYSVESNEIPERRRRNIDSHNHDTISMVVIDDNGSVIAGTSSNGAKFKIPGRIGDAPLPGAGAYADSTVGAGVATGDGDVMMRFLPSFLIVELMRNGASPEAAASEAISRIAKHYPYFQGAVIAVNKNGNFHAACHGIPEFPFSVATKGNPVVRTIKIKCQENNLYKKKLLSV